MEHLLVIGGVASGTKAGLKAKRENPDMDVTIITDEEFISYAACGIPYYLGGEVKDYEELIIKSPFELKTMFDINILTKHRAVEVNPKQKKIKAINLVNNTTIEIEYDILVIATGASPLVPPNLKLDAPNMFTVRSVSDAIKLSDYMKNNQVRSAAIVGGGFIGLEIAENLAKSHMDVSIIELQDHILPNFDNEIALNIEKYIKSKGISVLTNDQITEVIADDKGFIRQLKTTKRIIDTDLLIVSIGVRPNTGFLEGTEIKLTDRGAVEVDPFMETNIPDIYAVGDCVQSRNMLSGMSGFYPMGSTANKMGRICGNNIAADWEMSFKGVLGTVIMRFFDLNIAKTGLSEFEADRLGYDIETILITTDDKPKYFPGSNRTTIKLIAKREGQDYILIGGQVFGKGPSDKYVDTIATAVYFKSSVEDLINIDLAYSPVFSTPIGAVSLAAIVFYNKVQGKFNTISSTKFQSIKDNSEYILIDTRDEDEFDLMLIPGSKNIPLTEIKTRYAEIDMNKEVILICDIAKRAYLASRILSSLGFKKLWVLEGGIEAYPYELTSNY